MVAEASAEVDAEAAPEAPADTPDSEIDVTGTRKADGTLAGTVKAHFDEFNDAHTIVRVRNQEIPWTAERGLKNVVHFPR